ncbi:MAG: Spy/CpxP family protein refolding chaperone [Acidobacteria bacterium]|nr:Spy/CpxP family protein refolding chaperone [Acidobacteriota bacterium]
MRKIIILSTAAALVVAFASADLFAQRQGGPGRSEGRDGRPNLQAGDNQAPRRGGPGGPGRAGGGRFGGGPGMAGLGRNLDLTADQRTKVQEIVRGSRDKVGPIADQLRVAQNNLRRELFADQKDDARVKELASTVTELRKQMADIRISTSASIAELLTPEQREKMRVGEGRGPGAGRGGPGRGPGRGPGPVRG